MKILRRLAPGLAALALLLACALPARAQDRQLMGARVRVTAPSVLPGKFTGTVTEYDTQHLAVRDTTGAEQSFPLHSILFLEVSKGSGRGGNVGSRATLMAFVLGGLGAIGGGLAHPIHDESGPSAAIGGAAGALTGAAIGALWGASSSRERWGWIVRPFGYDPHAAPPSPAPPSPAPAPTPEPSAPASAPPPPPPS
ncbi:MAG: hypothetical protein ACJ8GN_09720 [Longimicrobiaceae bacterium]